MSDRHKSLGLLDGRLFCPSCGVREADLLQAGGETEPLDIVDEWECPHCKTPFTVPSGTAVRIIYTGNAAESLLEQAATWEHAWLQETYGVPEGAGHE